MLAAALVQFLAAHHHCAPLAFVELTLLGTYGEQITERRILDPHTLLVVFTSPKGETWTAAWVDSYTHATCLAGGGKNWENVRRVMEGTGL